MTEPAVYRDRTKGSIMRNLLSLSWPMIITESIYLVTVVEMMWVGRLGVAAVAGVGIAQVVNGLIMMLEVGFSTAARAMIARAVGAGDLAGANHIARQALFLSVAYGAVVTAIGFFLAGPILSLFRVEPDVFTAGVAYLRVFSFAWIPLSFWLMGYSVIQATGDTVNPMKVETSMRILLLVITPFLVLGWWFFPHMGVKGAALSNVLAEIAGMLFGLWVMWSGRTRLCLALKDFRVDLSTMRRIIRIGFPSSLMSVQNSLGGTVLMSLMVPFGTLAVAAHSLINRVSMVMFLPTYGLGLGAGILTGQNLGAGQPGRAERSGWLAAALTGAFSVAGSLAVLLWAGNIVSLFTSDSALVQTTRGFLQISALAFIVSGFGGTLRLCISGAGETMMPLIVDLVTVWAVQIPLAFLLPHIDGLGVYGIRWAIVAAGVVGLIAYAVYFRLGKWKQKKL